MEKCIFLPTHQFDNPPELIVDRCTLAWEQGPASGEDFPRGEAAVQDIQLWKNISRSVSKIVLHIKVQYSTELYCTVQYSTVQVIISTWKNRCRAVLKAGCCPIVPAGWGQDRFVRPKNLKSMTNCEAWLADQIQAVRPASICEANPRLWGLPWAVRPSSNFKACFVLHCEAILIEYGLTAWNWPQWLLAKVSLASQGQPHRLRLE